MSYYVFDAIRPEQVRVFEQNGWRCKYFVLAYDRDEYSGTVIILESSREGGTTFLIGTQQTLSSEAIFFGMSREDTL